jgi:protein SCO1/2
MKKKQNLSTFVVAIFAGVIFSGCFQEKPLPILGERDVQNNDTIFHRIGKFRFINQDSAVVTERTFQDKIYVADFFFTSCRSICPIMKTQMLRVYEAIEEAPDVVLLSHTIDPDGDSVEVLRDYAERLGVKSNKWHFVTGNRDSIYDIARHGYYVTTMEDKTEPDGFIHSGAFLLIDKQKRIRGKYDGTKEEDVNRLIKDIERLRREKDQQ